MRVPLSAKNSQAMCDESAGQLPAPQGMVSRCFWVFWYSATLQSCLCSTPDFRSFHMGIALFTLSAVQNPFRSLKKLLANPASAPKDRLDLRAQPVDMRRARPGNAPASASRSDDAQALVPSNSTEPLPQRPLRGNWPFTAKPPARTPESPTRSAATHRSFLPTHMAGSKRQAFLASVGADHCPPQSTRVLRRASDTGTCRLVIAGRMADVCAELDRLAASEALRA